MTPCSGDQVNECGAIAVDFQVCSFIYLCLCSPEWRLTMIISRFLCYLVHGMVLPRHCLQAYCSGQPSLLYKFLVTGILFGHPHFCTKPFVQNLVCRHTVLANPRFCTNYWSQAYYLATLTSVQILGCRHTVWPPSLLYQFLFVGILFGHPHFCTKPLYSILFVGILFWPTLTSVQILGCRHIVWPPSLLYKTFCT